MQQSGYFNLIFFAVILHLIETPLASRSGLPIKANAEARTLWFSRYEYTAEPVIRQTIQKAK